MTAAPLPFNPIPRQIERVARERIEGYPAIVVTGPRQSGKTTLARILSPDRPYFSLEDPDTRAFAVEDPRISATAGWRPGCWECGEASMYRRTHSAVRCSRTGR